MVPHLKISKDDKKELWILWLWHGWVGSAEFMDTWWGSLGQNSGLELSMSYKFWDTSSSKKEDFELNNSMILNVVVCTAFYTRF